MPLPNILRTQTPLLVPLLRRSIKPHAVIAGSKRTFAVSLLRRHDTTPPSEETPADSPAAEPGTATALPDAWDSAPLPLLSDVTNAFEETPETSRTEEPSQSSAPPGLLRPSIRRIMIDHRPRFRIYRKVQASPYLIYRPLRPKPGVGPLLEIQTRLVGGVTLRKFVSNRLARINSMDRVPVSLFEKDVHHSRQNLEGLVLGIAWYNWVERLPMLTVKVYITPEDAAREWEFWVRRQDPQAGNGGSPLAQRLNIRISRPAARFMYLYRQGSVRGGSVPSELSLVQRLVRISRRSSGPNNVVPKDTAGYLRFCRNVERILATPIDDGSPIIVEPWKGIAREFPRVEALTQTINMGLHTIFQLEKYIDYVSGREARSRQGASGDPKRQPTDFANFMLRNALLSTYRLDTNVRTLLDTPIDSKTVEIYTADGVSALPRVDALRKICQGFGSSNGLARLGVDHVLRREMGEMDFALKGYEKLASRIERNMGSLLAVPIEVSGERPQVLYYGKDRENSGYLTRFHVVDRVVQHLERAAFLAREVLRVSSLSQSVGGGAFEMSRAYYPQYKNSYKPGVRAYSTSVARVWKKSGPRPPPSGVASVGESRIRERFRVKEEIRASAMDGIRSNTVMKYTDVETVPSVDSIDDTLGCNWEGIKDMSDISDASAAKPLRIGDLSEIRSGNQAELGLFLRPTPCAEPTSDFLMTSGNIVQRQLPRITFSIPTFVPKDRVERFVKYYDRMLGIHGPEVDPDGVAAPRSITEEILDPVRRFGEVAASLYADWRPAFDNLYGKWAHETDERQITLYEATETVFGPGCTRNPEYNMMLYAMHTALMGDGLHFMGDRGMHRATNVFRVRSRRDIRMIDSVTMLIRRSANEQGTRGKVAAPENTGRKIMDRFIKKANYLIDLSRKHEREVQNGGKKGSPPVERVDIKNLKWDENDMFFIEYIKARVLKYGLQKTPIDGLAPVILRATNKYGDILDAATADTFLREIGAWSKWENTSLHQSGLDLPGLGRSKVGDADEMRFRGLGEKDAVKDLGLRDVMYDVRRDWGKMEVFTIDDPDAHEIDDGISLERISGTENWIHVHIANPTAFIPENHWIAEIARRRAIAHYLPDQMYGMLPEAITGPFLGVAPDRPVMTISTKVNDRGEIMDYKIQAGYVKNVRRTTYAAVDMAFGSHRNKEYSVDLKIGNFPKGQKNQEKPEEFTDQQLKDLEKMRDIALTIRRRRARDGLIIATPMDPAIRVHNHLGSENHPYSSPYPVLYRGHPAVHLTVANTIDVEFTDSQLLVSEMMSLANNVASIWAAERKLAMPFRVMEYDYRRPDVIKVMEEKVLPQRTELGRHPFESTIRWLMLLGQARLLPTPGPHMLMGLPTGYTKTTSPLRRYSDMIAQYQIQSFLRNETTKSVSQLEPLLASVQRMEQTAKHISKEGMRLWSAVAVKRGWEIGLKRFKFPRALSFMIMERHAFPTPSNGLVRELGLVGKLRFPGKRDEMCTQVGDVVSVEIEDVKLSERYIWFKYTGMIEKARANFGGA